MQLSPSSTRKEVSPGKSKDADTIGREKMLESRIEVTHKVLFLACLLMVSVTLNIVLQCLNKKENNNNNNKMTITANEQYQLNCQDLYISAWFLNND